MARGDPSRGEGRRTTREGAGDSVREPVRKRIVIHPQRFVRVGNTSSLKVFVVILLETAHLFL